LLIEHIRTYQGLSHKVKDKDQTLQDKVKGIKSVLECLTAQRLRYGSATTRSVSVYLTHTVRSALDLTEQKCADV